MLSTWLLNGPLVDKVNELSWCLCCFRSNNLLHVFSTPCNYSRLIITLRSLHRLSQRPLVSRPLVFLCSYSTRTPSYQGLKFLGDLQLRETDIISDESSDGEAHSTRSNSPNSFNSFQGTQQRILDNISTISDFTLPACLCGACVGPIFSWIHTSFGLQYFEPNDFKCRCHERNNWFYNVTHLHEASRIQKAMLQP